MITRHIDGIFDSDLTNIISLLNDRSSAYHRDMKKLHKALETLINIDDEIQKLASYNEKTDLESLEIFRNYIIDNAKDALDTARRGLKNNLPVAYAASKANPVNQDDAKERVYWRNALCNIHVGHGHGSLDSEYYKRFPEADPLQL